MKMSLCLPEQENVLQCRLSVSLPSHKVTLAREHVRVRDCCPSPHVWLHALQRDHGNQPARRALCYCGCRQRQAGNKGKKFSMPYQHVGNEE